MSGAMSYPCVCGATVRVSESTACGPSQSEDPSSLATISTELRVVHHLVHDGDGMTDSCRTHIDALRDEISRSDVEVLRVLEDTWNIGRGDAPDEPGDLLD
jgi:hypothetical protein